MGLSSAVVPIRLCDMLGCRFCVLSVISHLQERRALIEKLPRLTEKDLEGTRWKRKSKRLPYPTQSANKVIAEDTCPICYNTFLAIIAEEEMAHAMESSGVEEMGLTRLVDTCNHMFCRKELSDLIKFSVVKITNYEYLRSIIKWIQEGVCLTRIHHNRKGADYINNIERWLSFLPNTLYNCNTRCELYDIQHDSPSNKRITESTYRC